MNVRNGVDKRFITLTKVMQRLADLNIKLLKTVTINVFESNDDCKISNGMGEVLLDSGEGRIFL